MSKTRAVIFILIVGIIVYCTSLLNGFVWDDEEQIVNNIAVHSAKNLMYFFSGSTFNTGGAGHLSGIYYKPVMTGVFSVLYTVFGQQPFFFHLFQVTLHIFNSILIFFLFASFFHSVLSFFLSLIFLVHPLNVEAVSYISALQDVLFFSFGMSALFLLKNTMHRKFTGPLTAIFLLFSLLSKETGILFVGMIGMYVYLFERKKLNVYLLYTLVCVGVYVFLRFAVAKVFVSRFYLSPISNAPLSQRLISMPSIILYYVRTFLFPIHLVISQHWVVRSPDLMRLYIPLFVIIITLCLLIACALYLFRKSRQLCLIFCFFFFWFVAGIAFHSQIIPLDMTVADRWFYFPMVGLLGIFGVMLKYTQGKFCVVLKITNVRIFLYVLGFCIVFLLSVRTGVRSLDWKNGLTLYSHDINLSRDSFDLENNYGVELFRNGQYEESKKHFQKSIALEPSYYFAYNNLGAVYEREKDFIKAKEMYLKTLSLADYYTAYENLAKLMFYHDDIVSTKEFIQKALKKLPNNPNLWLMYALTEYRLGGKEEALQAAEKSYMLSPNKQSLDLYSRLKNNIPLETR